jgi:hypothetical protein
MVAGLMKLGRTAAVLDSGGEATDRGADIIICRIGCIAGSASWGEREPDVLLAKALPRWSIGRR